MIAKDAVKPGTNHIQVQLVTGYNTDRADIRAGGSSILGPYHWVPKVHATAFAAEMERRYQGKVHGIRIGKTKFLPLKGEEIPSLEEYLASFEEYLSDPNHW